MTAFGTHPPYAVFSDSLEVYSADWTPDFMQQFKKRRGYDLTPFLPALAGDIGPKTLDIRHDWGKTLTELVDENYLTPINEWAKQHGTRFRSQTYGYPQSHVEQRAGGPSRRRRSRNGAGFPPRAGRPPRAISTTARSLRLRPGPGCIRRCSAPRLST